MKRPSLALGYSPCPNDTFIFYALVRARLHGAPEFHEVLEDIETLNRMARKIELDVVKVSFHAIAYLLDNYCLLHSGGALGRACGPLVVAKHEVSAQELSGQRVAIPGELTTAALLLRLFAPDCTQLIILPFHEILDAVDDGRVDAGVIIHESRFTYADRGLCKVVDLGEWWEEETGHAIPLGGIVARRGLGDDLITEIDRSLRASVEFAHAHPDETWDYIVEHAQEMDRSVMKAHIDLYVNRFTLDYGQEGTAAIKDLLRRASDKGIVPSGTKPLFLKDGDRK